MRLPENLIIERLEHKRSVAKLISILKAQQDKPVLNIGGHETIELTTNDYVIVGNNGKTLIRNIKKDQYTGPSAQDFINRGKSLYQTALEMLGKDESSSEILQKVWENFCNQIKERCQIDPAKMKSMNSQESLDYFAPIYDEAKTLLTQFVASLSQELIKNQNTEDPSKKITDVKAMGKFLFKAEAERISKQGRPNITHLIEIDQNITLISDQRTLGATTNTSSMTTESLRNYVEATTAVIRKTPNSDGSTSQTILIRDQGRRAGALCGYGEENSFVRQANNAAAARTMLMDAVKEYIKSHGINQNNSIENPLPFDFFSTTLVSPMFGKASAILQKVKGLPSELQMVSEHNQALMLFNNQPIVIEMDGKKIYIAPKVNHFNIPTNIDKTWLSDLVIDDKQDSLNSPSLNNYFNIMEEYFLNKGAFQKGYINNIKDVTPDMRSHLNGIAHIFNFITNEINDNPEIKELIKGLNNKRQSTIELPNKQKVSIEDANKVLMDLLVHIKENPQNGLLQSQYNTLSKAIEKYYDNINEDYKKIIKKRSEFYEKRADQFEFLYSEILSFLQKNKEFLSSTQGDRLKQDLLALQSYIHCHKLCFNDNKTGNYKTRQNAFYLLANMQLSLFNAGIIYSFGCKSAEDRTGLLNVNKEAMIQFAEQYGFYPDPVPSKTSENEYQAREAYNRKFQEYIPDLVYKTASVENTNQNSPGARGLQVPHKISKAMGLLAKGIFKKSPGIKFSQTQIPLQAQDIALDRNIAHFLIQFNRYQFDKKQTKIKFGITRDQLDILLVQLHKENFTGINKLILSHYIKDELSLQSAINSLEDELKILYEQAKQESEKKQNMARENLALLRSNPNNPSLQKGTNNIYDLMRDKEQELKSLLEFQKVQLELKRRYQYMHDLGDPKRTISLLHHISQLERHDVAREKNRLIAVENGLAQLAQQNPLQCKTHFENLDKCKIALLIQEAKYNLLMVKLASSSNESSALILEDQKHYAKTAITELQKQYGSGVLKEKEKTEINIQIERLQKHLQNIESVKIKSVRFNKGTSETQLSRSKPSDEYERPSSSRKKDDTSKHSVELQTKHRERRDSVVAKLRNESQPHSGETRKRR